jgi:hypothetical protein
MPIVMQLSNRRSRSAALPRTLTRNSFEVTLSLAKAART